LASPRDATGLTSESLNDRCQKQYFRPTEVEVLLGDPTKANKKLGWKYETSAQSLCAEMVREDLKVVGNEKHYNFD
jgi:GDPmannose 4,6-dehydratase